MRPLLGRCPIAAPAPASPARGSWPAVCSSAIGFSSVLRNRFSRRGALAHQIAAIDEIAVLGLHLVGPRALPVFAVLLAHEDLDLCDARVHPLLIERPAIATDQGAEGIDCAGELREPLHRLL